MRLLFVTQVVDRNDAALGAYHGWLIELAKHFERIEVICLYEGEHALPSNVQVHSLGKERGPRSSVVYALRFLRRAWRLRNGYDGVFVHMNQEYLLLAGWLWGLLGKRMYLWRNHYAGSWLTDLAALFCAKIFCTSKHSYTAKYAKTIFMPVGVDTNRFSPDGAIVRAPRSILFLARMSPSKRPDILIEALGLLIKNGTSFIASFYGSPAKGNEAYYASLRERCEALGLHDRVRFYPAIPNEKTPNIFRAHDIFVNCSPSGMFDKTIFEAAASGCRVLAVSEDWKALVGSDWWLDASNPSGIAERLAAALSLTTQPRSMRQAAEENSLGRLVSVLAEEI